MNGLGVEADEGAEVPLLVVLVEVEGRVPERAVPLHRQPKVSRNKFYVNCTKNIVHFTSLEASLLAHCDFKNEQYPMPD